MANVSNHVYLYRKKSVFSRYFVFDDVHSARWDGVQWTKVLRLGRSQSIGGINGNQFKIAKFQLKFVAVILYQWMSILWTVMD